MSRVITLRGPRVHRISPVGTEKIYGGNDLPKSQVLSSEWNTERVREDASGDSEDGEDDELPCVIGESAGDCVWRGSWRSVGSLFHREGAAYLKERFVIFKEEWVGGRARCMQSQTTPFPPLLYLYPVFFILSNFLSPTSFPFSLLPLFRPIASLSLFFPLSRPFLCIAFFVTLHAVST